MVALMVAGSAAFTPRVHHTTPAIASHMACGSMTAPFMCSGDPAKGERGYKRAKLRKAWSSLLGGESSEAPPPAEVPNLVAAYVKEESVETVVHEVAEVAQAVAEAAAEEAEAAVEAAAEVEVEEEVEAAAEVETETGAATEAETVAVEASAEMAAVATSAAAVAAPGPAEHDPSSPGPRWSAEETERFSSVDL